MNAFRRRRSRLEAGLVAAVAAATTVWAALLSPVPGAGAVGDPGAVSAASTTSVVPPTSTATTVIPASAQMVDDRVTLSVDSLGPGVLASGQDVTVSGTIANGTDAPLESLSLTARVQDSTEVTTANLESWLADEQDTRLRSVRSEDLGTRIAPGEIRTFSLTIAGGDLPFDDEDQWGPRGLEVAAAHGRDTVAQDRTLLVWDTGEHSARSGVTTIIPVTASPSDLALLTTGAETPSEASLANLRSRISSLLALSGDGVVLAVDPALLQALGVTQETLSSATSPSSTNSSASPSPSPAGSASPTPSPSGSPTAPASPGPSSTPTPSPSPSGSAAAQQAAGQALSKALVQALAAGDVVALPWADADIAALAHLGENDLLSDAAGRTASSTTVSAGAPTSLAWLAGDLDSTTLSALPQAATTLVTALDDLSVTEELTYTPSETTTIDSRTVLIPDRSLSQALAGRLVTEESSTDLSDLDAVQLLRGETAVLTRQAPAIGRSLVVALQRVDAGDVDPQALGMRLAALRDSSWTSPQNLESLTARTRAEHEGGTAATRTEVPDDTGQDGALPASDLESARAARTYLDSVTSILTDPQAVIGSAAEVVPRTAAAVWRSDPAGRTAMANAARERGSTVTTKLTAVPSHTINLIAAEANLPVRLTSSLNQDAAVVVRLSSGSARLQTVKDVTVTVPANGQATATVPVKAVGSGDVDLTITVLAADGTAVGAPQSVHMRVRADWETRGTQVVGAGLVILLAGGIVRTVRRGRRTAVPDGVPPDDIPDSIEEKS